MKKYSDDGEGAGEYRPPTTITKTMPVKKIWDDADNQDGKHPDSITVVLQGGEEDIEQVITEKDQWSATFECVPVYKAGEEIKYSVTEETIDEYTPTITDSADEGFTITNTCKTAPKPSGNGGSSYKLPKTGIE